mmetsp:Transcript_13566/g.20025  ORF Transcript_13566/g.20025 Transcript_13566/m.20025 type:complete len:267 (-) Transcript_13566:58-858(-)
MMDRKSNLLSEQLNRSRDCLDFNGSATELLDDLSKDANVPLEGLVKKMLNIDDLLSDSDCSDDEEEIERHALEEELQAEWEGTTTQLLYNLSNDAGTRFEGLVEKMLAVDDFLSDTECSDDDDEEEDFSALEQELIENYNNDQNSMTMLSFLEESYRERQNNSTNNNKTSHVATELGKMLQRVLDIEDDFDFDEEESLSEEDEGIKLEDALQKDFNNTMSASIPTASPWSSVHSKGLKHSTSSTSPAARSIHERYDLGPTISNAAA